MSFLAKSNLLLKFSGGRPWAGMYDLKLMGKCFEGETKQEATATLQFSSRPKEPQYCRVGSLWEELSAFGISRVWFRAGGVVNGKDAVSRSPGSRLFSKDVETDLVKLLGIPVGLGEEVLKFLIIGMRFAGDGG